MSHMNTDRIERSRTTWALLIVAAALGSTFASSAADKTGAAGAADAQARYQQDRAACMSGPSNQDQATCLREAGAALAQARREGMGDGSAPNSRNALQRCDTLPDADRQACVVRMQGQGTTSGSAASGGIYRELVTPEVAASSPAAPPSAAQGAAPDK
jgi:hypothetical protein